MADNTEPRPALPKQLPASNRAGFGIAAAKSAYHYPLIIKHLWHAPLLQAADQEIVYRDLRRFTYREFRERVGRLASALAGLGVRPGDTARGRPGERGGEAGLPIATVRTFEEFRKEPQYAEVLSRMPLISVEKIGESEPIPFKKDGTSPLDGIRAFGMGHVIAGAGMGRDLAYYGADVLNIWRPENTEIEAFVWDVQVGMRSTILDYSKDDRAKFDHLLKDADVFFANKRAGYLERNGLDAEELSAKKPGLIHASVVLHGDKGPWKNRVGFDEIGGAVSGLFCIEGTPTHPKSPPIIPICDNVVGWLGTVGILAALRRRAVEGGSYRVVVSLTRTLLWLYSLGIFDKAYAQAAAGSSDEHANIAPDLFTAETPLGTYQGMTDQVILSRTPGSFRAVLVPRGSSKPEWLAR